MMGIAKHTPLHSLHKELGARMVDFAGYRLPMQYQGIIAEHCQCREAAALFDVSHMGQIEVRGSGAAAALERLMPLDLQSLAAGRSRYGMFTNERGGILDDLIISRIGEGHFVMVVNAARKQADLAHLRAALPPGIKAELMELALLAIQGPQAADALHEMVPQAVVLRFMGTMHTEDGVRVTRCGYTGEDGFEIAVPPADAPGLARQLLADPRVSAAGLGARDSLRLEAGLCLHGQDIDESTDLVEADLLWAINAARRQGGARAGGFPGAEAIIAGGGPRRRVGLEPEGRVPLRPGAVLTDPGGRAVGRVTSGGFAPSLGHPVAMGYVEASHSEPNAELRAEIRGESLAVRILQMPFIDKRYA